MLDTLRSLPIDFYMILPLCVPAWEMDNAIAKLTAYDLKLLVG